MKIVVILCMSIHFPVFSRGDKFLKVCFPNPLSWCQVVDKENFSEVMFRLQYLVDSALRLVQSLLICCKSVGPHHDLVWDNYNN